MAKERPVGLGPRGVTLTDPVLVARAKRFIERWGVPCIRLLSALERDIPTRMNAQVVRVFDPIALSNGPVSLVLQPGSCLVSTTFSTPDIITVDEFDYWFDDLTALERAAWECAKVADGEVG